MTETQVRELDIPEEELEEYREAFNLFDKDGSGSISPDEFIKVLKNLGQKVTKDEARKICEELDQDGSGSVEFDEFVSYMKKIKAQDEEPPAEQEQEDAVIKAFKTFDKNKDGTISIEEFRYILCRLGEEKDRFSVEECDEIFREADLNKDGSLDYKEFVRYWRNK